MVYQATGIVLAGGKSSRMGRDKALLQFHNQTLISSSVEKLQKLFEEVIIVTNQPGKYEIHNVKEVTDIYPGRGPLGGIHSGIQAARFEWAFITACDMPFWEISIVEALLKARSDYDVVVPKMRNKLEPLFALYRKTCLPVIKSCLEQNISKIINFYPQMGVNYLNIEALCGRKCMTAQAFANINTPEDLFKMITAKGLKTDIDMEEAQKLILENIVPLHGEQVLLNQSLNRVLSEDQLAPASLPGESRSSVDGYALCNEDINSIIKKGHVKLKVLEKVFAGNLPHYDILSGMTSKVMTGAVIPQGAKAIVKYENIKEDGPYVYICNKVKIGKNIIKAGSEVQAGEKIAEKGRLITPSLVSLLAANGYGRVPVYTKVKAAVICTGSELSSLREPLEAGKSYNSNMYLLDGMLRNMGVESILTDIVPDSAARISAAMQDALQKAHIVISLGGVSAGEHDLVKQALVMLGAELLFSGISMKPGKSFVAGKKDGKLILGLSGNPGSAFTNFELLVRPVLRKMMGCSDFLPQKVEVSLPCEYKNTKHHRKIEPAELYFENGMVKAKLLKEKGMLKSLLESNLLIDISPERVISAGECAIAYYIEGVDRR